MNLHELYTHSTKLGKLVLDAGIIDREYEITRLGFNNRDKVVLGRVKDCEDYIVYTNLMTSREDISRLLGARSLEDMYMMLERSLSPSVQLETVGFSDFFEEVSVDLESLPFIKYFREDGGYYLTSSIYITCYGEICNASYHRTMLLTRETATLRIVPRHLHYIVSRFFELGKDAPVAIVLGLDPIHELAAAMSPPLGVFEVEVAASLGGERRVVKTPKYGIPVPANASVVIEGVISRDLRAREGPFTDMLLIPDVVREQPVFVAERMYVSKHREPVIHAIIPGLVEHQLLMGLPREAHIYVEAKRVAPCLRSVRLTEGGFTWLGAVLSVSRNCSRGDAKLAALAAITAHPSLKYVVVVDDDIDISNPLMVEWAIATRSKPSEDVIVLREVRGSTLEPRSKDGIGDKMIILALIPRDEPYEKYKRVEIP